MGFGLGLESVVRVRGGVRVRGKVRVMGGVRSRSGVRVGCRDLRWGLG